MANTDVTFRPDSAAPDPNAPRPDQGPSAAPAGMAPFIPTNPRRQRYVNLSQNRPLDQLGKPDWVLDAMNRYPGISPVPAPQPDDVNSMKFQISHQLSGSGQGGPQGMGRIAQLAAQWGNHSGEYLKGAMQGQEYAMRLAKEKADFAEGEMVRHSLRVIEDARYAIDFHGDNPNVFNELIQVARKNDDPRLEEAAKSGKLENVKKYLQWMDHNVLPVMQIRKQRLDQEAEEQRIQTDREKASTAQETARARREALAGWGVTGVDPSGSTGAEATPADTNAPAGDATAASAQPGAPAAAAPESGSDEAAPPVPGLGGVGPQAAAPEAAPGAGQTADAGPAAAPEGPQEVSAAPLGPDDNTAPAADLNAPRRIPTSPGSPGQPGTAPSAPGGGGQAPAAAPAAPAAAGALGAAANARMRTAAHEILMGRKPDFGPDKVVASILYPRANALAGQMQTQIAAVENDPRMTGDAALQAIRRIDPELAGDIGNLRDGGRPPTGREAQKPGFQQVLRLLRKVDPTFNVNDINLRYSTMRSFATGADARTLTSMATSSHHLDTLTNAAEALRQYQASGHGELFNSLVQQWNTQLGWHIPYLQSTGDAAYDAEKAYNTVLDMVSPEVARAAKGAAPTQSEIEHVRHNLGSQVPGRTLLKNIGEQRELIAARLGELRRRYDAGVGANPRLGIERLFTAETTRGEFGQNSTGPEGTITSPLVPMPQGFDYAAGLRQAESYRSSAGGAVSVSTPEEAQRLAPGTMYTTPDGHRYRR